MPLGVGHRVLGYAILVTSYHARRGMAALPDLVLNTASDPERTASWLPGAPHVRLQTSADGSCVEWEPLDGESSRGSLKVAPSGAGTSVVDLDVEIDVADETLAERMLDALAAEVEQNFTAG